MWISIAIPTKIKQALKIGVTRNDQPGSDRKITTGSAPAGGWVRRNADMAVIATPTDRAIAHHSGGRTIRRARASTLANT